MNVNKSVKLIRSKSKGRRPKVGIILGSGLGFFADIVENKLSFSYDDLPGFPKAGVAGHVGQLTLGQINGTEIAVLQGRAHYYESGQADVMKTPIHTLVELGCEILILTNAAGSLMPDAKPGSVMSVSYTHLTLPTKA